MRAEIRLPDIMSDNMVLQQLSSAKIWGWAEHDSQISVTVSWSKDKYTTMSDMHGNWMLTVKTPEASNVPQTISIRENKGKTTFINNVLIGEVWFCSGQSNMFMQLGGYSSQPVEGAPETIMNSSRYKNVRVALISKRAATTPQEKVDGRWMESAPENASKFPAAAYYFATRLNGTLDIPIGIICCSWGGSHIAGWMPEELVTSLGYKDAAAHAADENRKNGRPLVMYNGMLYPLRHYTIKGFLWYQGCSDVAEYGKYALYQSEMVKHWRELWGLGELPFYFVEIAPYDYDLRRGLKGYMLREAQQKALDMIPNSGMASTVDLVKPYERKIIHPSRKKEVGDRLAMLALNHTYNIKGIESDSPRFAGMEIQENGSAKIRLTNCSNGFSVTYPIEGFEAAGKDRVFYHADARILPDKTICVSCPQVKEIASVRYLYSNFVIANLKNMWGLPVLPFRTDDWDEDVHTGNDIPEEAKSILQYVKAPEFRPKDYNALDFGAIADSTVDSRQAINKAILTCSNEGGGRVVVPAGKYLSKGPIILHSNVNLHISEGATIYFSENPKDYLPAVLTVWEGTEMYNYSPFVYAYHCNNIALTGKGTLHGRAKNGFAKMRPQRSAMQDKLRQMGIDQVPVHERYFGASSIMPPNMIEPFGCKNVLIEDITILDSPYWVIHPTFCDNVTVRGVTIDSYNLNNDGCDPEYTTNVLIENCTFRCGDDAIAIKAGRDQDAWRIGQKTANIVIRNCNFFSRCNGLCIGSEMAAGVENVYMYDTCIERCYSGIYFKSNLDRGGFIRNVWVNNITCGYVKTAFISFYTNYHGARGGFHPTAFENFTIQNVKGGKSELYGFYLVGIEGYPMKNIFLKNVELEQAKISYVLQHSENVRFNNVHINGELMPATPKETSGNETTILKD